MDNAITPSVKRRLATMLYETMLLFGVVFFAEAVLLFCVVGLAQMPITVFVDHPQAPLLQQAWIFLTLGIYFTYFWRKNGQTLPMQTWRIRLVNNNNVASGVPMAKAVARYLLAWMWFIPGWFIGHAFDLGKGATIGLMLLNIAAWACTVKFNKDRQFLHDQLLGTRLIEVAPDAKPQTS